MSSPPPALHTHTRPHAHMHARVVRPGTERKFKRTVDSARGMREADNSVSASVAYYQSE